MFDWVPREPLTPEMSITTPCLILLPRTVLHLSSPLADSVTIPKGPLDLYFLRGS